MAQAEQEAYAARLSACGVRCAKKKLLVMPTPKFANLMETLERESDAETGVVSAGAEGRLEVEMRKALIDFFERFFLWCALFRPVKGSRGMRRRTALTMVASADGFKGAIFTLDCSHAFGYVNEVCGFLAGNAEEAKKVFRKAKDRMYEHDFDRAEKYLRSKYKAHFTEDGMKHWSEEAAKAWKYLDARRKYMNYGWLRRHGYLIGSGHIESACKVIRRVSPSGRGSASSARWIARRCRYRRTSRRATDARRRRTT